MFQKLKIQFVTFFLLLIPVMLFAQYKGDTLKVGIAGSEPFVFKKNLEPRGIAIEIWKELAIKKKYTYRYISYSSVDEALKALNKGELDLVAGPISITSNRMAFMRFSQPFYNSSLAIVSRTDKLSIWEKIKPFFSFKLLLAVLIFLFILSVVGLFLWLAERKKSPDQFPYDPVNGIANGMWLAIVTMSTTGYGDKAPITLWGRIIAGSWMIISLIFATSMVAGIASTLTLSSLGTSTISNIEQLYDKRAATITASPSEFFLNESKIKTLGVDNLTDAIKKLKNKNVDAVVYDRPQLLYYLKNHADENLHIAKAEYFNQGYGFAFPMNTKLIYDVNRALLELTEEQEVARIVEYYLDKDE